MIRARACFARERSAEPPRAFMEPTGDCTVEVFALRSSSRQMPKPVGRVPRSGVRVVSPDLAGLVLS